MTRKFLTCPQRPAPCTRSSPEHHSHNYRRSQGHILVIPDLKGKFDGYALRVPTPTVSVVDFTAQIEKPTTTEKLRQAFRDAAAGRLKGILAAIDEPLVSVDFKGDAHSSSVDLPFTSVLGGEGDFIKVVTWYDNEWGYSVRTADLANLMAVKL